MVAVLIGIACVCGLAVGALVVIVGHTWMMRVARHQARRQNRDVRDLCGIIATQRASLLVFPMFAGSTLAGFMLQPADRSMFFGVLLCASFLVWVGFYAVFSSALSSRKK